MNLIERNYIDASFANLAEDYLVNSNFLNPSNYLCRTVTSEQELLDALENRELNPSIIHKIGKPFRAVARSVAKIAIPILVCPVGMLYHGSYNAYFVSKQIYYVYFKGSQDYSVKVATSFSNLIKDLTPILDVASISVLFWYLVNPQIVKKLREIIVSSSMYIRFRLDYGTLNRTYFFPFLERPEKSRFVYQFKHETGSVFSEQVNADFLTAQTMPLLDFCNRNSEQNFIAALELANNMNNQNQLRFLARQATTTQLRDVMVLSIASSCSIELMELLLQQGPISSSTRDSARTQAARNLEVNSITEMLLMALIDDSASALQAAYAIKIDSVRTQPYETLQAFIRRGSFPYMFFLEDSPRTIDLGGVSKQVISTLFSSLYEKKMGYWSPQKFLIYQGDDIKQEDKKFYSDLAQLLFLIDQRNKDRSDKFLIGHIFHAQFFNLLKIYHESSEPEKLKNLVQFLKDQEPNPFYDWFLNPTEENKEAYRSYLQEITSEEITDERIRSEADKQISNTIEPVKAFLSGLPQELKQKIFTQDPANLLKAIQGNEITAPAILESLRVMPNAGSPSFDKCIEYLREKISERGNKEDIDWLKKFILAVTGRTSLMPGSIITIQSSHRGNIFELHTCFNSLDIPSLLPDNGELKERFLEGLETAISDNSSYNIA